MAGMGLAGKTKPKEPETTLRFNKNAIEAWNGKIWLPVIEIELTDDGLGWGYIEQNEPYARLSIEIPKPKRKTK